MAKDALGAHARDELGISEVQRARPLQAAISSAAAFAAGAMLPILAVLLSPQSVRVVIVPAASLLCLASLGALAAKVGGAPVRQGAMRVGVLGALAMALTSAVGAIFGIAA
jgi:VIT1/CCC1 family predicted Fe2+/Mn2+ transporter